MFGTQKYRTLVMHWFPGLVMLLVGVVFHVDLAWGAKCALFGALYYLYKGVSK